jgi:site-specific recombinase XerC
LKAFLWYTREFNWPDNIELIATQHLREFLVYVRETKERWGSNCLRAKQPVNSTTVQKYYRALSVMFNWLISEEILSVNPLDRIKAPRAEKKVVKGLANTEVSTLISFMGNSFEGKRNKAMILVLVDCGLRLGELLNTKLADVNMEQQTIKVDGKTGERGQRPAGN